MSRRRGSARVAARHGVPGRGAGRCRRIGNQERQSEEQEQADRSADDRSGLPGRRQRRPDVLEVLRTEPSPPSPGLHRRGRSDPDEEQRRDDERARGGGERADDADRDVLPAAGVNAGDPPLASATSDTSRSPTAVAAIARTSLRGLTGTARSSSIRQGCSPARAPRQRRRQPESAQPTNEDATPTPPIAGKEGLDGSSWGQVLGTGQGVSRVAQRASREGRSRQRKRHTCKTRRQAVLPHPPAASRGLHGKEGSTVRVRQRALQSRRKMVPFPLGSTCICSGVHRVWSRLWSFQVHDARSEVEQRPDAVGDRPSFARVLDTRVLSVGDLTVLCGRCTSLESLTNRGNASCAGARVDPFSQREASRVEPHAGRTACLSNPR